MAAQNSELQIQGRDRQTNMSTCSTLVPEVRRRRLLLGACMISQFRWTSKASPDEPLEQSTKPGQTQ